MTFLEQLKATFTDHDGSIAVPEVVATFAAINCVVCPFVDWIRGTEHYPVASVSASLMGIVVALAAAQRVRDGLPPRDGDH
jgi:hypothetical protein